MVFSCLGELCWYLSGIDDGEFISYYIPAYKDIAEDGAVYGAYGPRLFDWNGINQVQNVITRLQQKPNTRRAVIQIFSKEDLPSSAKDIPCTCTIQFLLRADRLHMLVVMRSNDVIIGLPHDIFCFTMLQEIVARTLDVDIGWYRQCIGSLHIYKQDFAKASLFVSEGWQTTRQTMPPMPDGDPSHNVHRLLEVARIIRQDGMLQESSLKTLDPYWTDLARLLLVYAAARNNDLSAMEEQRSLMSSHSYNTYIDRRLAITKNHLQQGQAS